VRRQAPAKTLVEDLSSIRVNLTNQCHWHSAQKVDFVSPFFKFIFAEKKQLWIPASRYEHLLKKISLV
jgi:hypothetical protein